MSTTEGAGNINLVLAAARLTYERVTPEELPGLVSAGALLVDTRPHEQRERDGLLPGAVIIDRNVLEWRLDPTCPNRAHDGLHERPVVVVCNQGYSSTLAVMSLRAVGVARATDLVGGFQALIGTDHLRLLRDQANASGRLADQGATSFDHPPTL